MGENPCETKQSLYPLSLNDHKVLIQRTPEELPFVPRPVHQPQIRDPELPFRTSDRGAERFEKKNAHPPPHAQQGWALKNVAVTPKNR